MNWKNGSLNWKIVVNLSNRVERLENRMNPKRVQVFSLEDGETELEASMRYCTDNGLELEKFENGDYGQVILITSEFVSPD